MDFQMFSLKVLVQKVCDSTTEKTKVDNKAVIVTWRIELKWLHWQKFHFECAIDVKRYSNYEVDFPTLASLFVC